MSALGLVFVWLAVTVLLTVTCAKHSTPDRDGLHAFIVFGWILFGIGTGLFMLGRYSA